MPILKAKQNRVARTLINSIFLQAELMLVNGVKGYRKFTADADALEAVGGDIVAIAQFRKEALLHLSHGLNMPARVKHRVTNLVDKLKTKLGSQAAAMGFIDTALAGYHGGVITRQELIDHLDGLIAIADAAIDGRTIGGWTLDQTAAYVESAGIDDDDDIYAMRDEGFVPRFTEGE